MNSNSTTKPPKNDFLTVKQLWANGSDLPWLASAQPFAARHLSEQIPYKDLLSK